MLELPSGDRKKTVCLGRSIPSRNATSGSTTGTARRDPARNKRSAKKKCADSEINVRVGGFHFKENTLQQTRKRDRTNQTDDASDHEQLHPVRKNQGANLGGTRAERETDADFADAFERGVSEHAIKADGGQHQSETGENGKEKTQQTLRAPGFLDAIEHHGRAS